MKGSPTSFDVDDSDTSLLDHYLDARILEPSTEETYQNAWKFLNEFAEKEGIEIVKMNEHQAAEFCEFLKQEDSIVGSTAAGYVSALRNMVNWYCSRGMLDYNPFELALEDDPFDNTYQKVIKEIELDELRASLQTELHPTTLTLVVLLLKTGLRIAEAVNLDYRDIHLDHSINEEMPSPRAEIANKPDTLYVDSSISKGEVHNGELRKHGNKPQSDRAIPIDSELKNTLVWYILLSPPSASDAKPLMRNQSRYMGKRFSDNTLRERYFRTWAKENGWYSSGRNDQVTPHWCRHWFTTVLRQRIDQDEIEMGSVEHYIKGLRGDAGDDVIDIYTHNWGNNQWMRDAYLNNIPSLFSE